MNTYMTEMDELEQAIDRLTQKCVAQESKIKELGAQLEKAESILREVGRYGQVGCEVEDYFKSKGEPK